MRLDGARIDPGNLSNLILLGGPTGVGKTTVLGLLENSLPRAALLDADDVRRFAEDVRHISEEVRPIAEDVRHISEDVRRSAEDVRRSAEDLAVEGARNTALGNVIAVMRGYFRAGCETGIVSWVFARPPAMIRSSRGWKAWWIRCTCCISWQRPRYSKNGSPGGKTRIFLITP